LAPATQAPPSENPSFSGRLCDGEVVAAGEGVGMVRTKGALVVGEGPGEQVNSFLMQTDFH
jgi:hypothetical protein